MIGLIVMVVGAIYLVLLVWATRKAYRWAKGKGLSKAKCRLIATGGFLAVYLPVFWNHIPTLVGYEYLCASEAGIMEYTPVDQWKKENQGVAENIRKFDDGRFYTLEAGHIVYPLSERISWHKKISLSLLNITRYEDSIRDEMTNKSLATAITFQAGRCSGAPNNFSDFMFWNNHCVCSTSRRSFITEQGLTWSAIYKQYAQLGVK